MANLVGCTWVFGSGDGRVDLIQLTGFSAELDMEWETNKGTKNNANVLSLMN